MKRLRPVAAFILLTAGACASSKTAQPATGSTAEASTSAASTEPSDALYPRFAWPGGARARVEVVQRGTQAQGSTYDMRGTFELEVARDGEQTVVLHRGFTGWQGALPKRALGTLGSVIVYVPRMFIDQQGAFQRIEGAAQVRESFRADFERFGIRGEHLQELVDSITSEAGTTAMAQDYWDQLVGAWAAAELAPGESLPVSGQVGVPQLGGGTITLDLKYQNRGPVPCPGATGAPACVELHLASSPDPASVERVLGRVLAAFGRLTSVALESDVTLITDPRTLQPRSFAITRDSVFTAEFEGQSREVRTQFEVVFTFDWLEDEG